MRNPGFHHAHESVVAKKAPAIRWIFEVSGTRDCPLTVRDSSALKAAVFECTLVVANHIIMHVRGGDLSRPAVVPRVGRGKAKAKSFSRVSSRSEVAK